MEKFFLKLSVTLICLLFFTLLAAFLSETENGGIFIFLLVFLFGGSIYYLQRRIDKSYTEDTPNNQSIHNNTPIKEEPSDESNQSHILSKPISPNPPEKRLCSALWTSVASFREKTGLSPNLYADTYIWTAFFYTVVKRIRNQRIVDDIYSYFGQTAYHEIQYYAVNCVTPLLKQMRTSYAQFAIVLNMSQIDPRTPEGIDQLWELLSQWMAKSGYSFTENSAAFKMSVNFLGNFTKAVFHSSYPSSNKPIQYSISDQESSQTELPT